MMMIVGLKINLNYNKRHGRKLLQIFFNRGLFGYGMYDPSKDYLLYNREHFNKELRKNIDIQDI